MTIHRLKQLVTYQRLVSQESSYYVLLECYDYPQAETIIYLSKTCWSGVIILCSVGGL